MKFPLARLHLRLLSISRSNSIRVKMRLSKVSKKAKEKSEGKIKKINADVAGIDLGFSEHYVCVPEGRSSERVRTFGCFTPLLTEMRDWLKSCGVKTVVMEATGVYWIPVYEILDDAGFEVLLVNACHVKNVPGRKTDVLDCQWLQELGSYGLLRGGFIPKKEIGVLRSYARQREEHSRMCAHQILLMQKALDLMNLHLHKVLSDISGVTGFKIIRAILAGERDPKILAEMRDEGVKASREEIVQALTGNYRKEHLFALRQAVELYDVYQQKLFECDQEIERYLKTFASKGDPSQREWKSEKRRKNQPHFALSKELFRITGVDLTKIPGISALTAQVIISELGSELDKFPTEKHLASWLGLAPNNKITGGRVKSSGTKKVTNRVATALRIAAMSLQRSQTALGAFYRRMRARRGAPKAITATAHKLAKIVYRLLKHGQEYVERGQQYYEQHYQQRLLKGLQKTATTLGFKLVPIDLQHTENIECSSVVS